MAFLRVDAMRRRRTRDACLFDLHQEFGRVLPILRQDMDLYDIREIVIACLSHPGALQILVGVVERFHPGSNSVRAVRDLVMELLPEPLLLPGERRDLYQLTDALENGAADPDVLSMTPLLYREAVGPTGPLLERPVEGLKDVLAELEDLPFSGDEAPPLLKFVEPLASRAREPVAGELRVWIERFAGRLGLPSSGRALPVLPRPGHAEAADRAYLVIECRPDSADPDGFLASAWLQYRDEPGIPLLREELPRSLDELPELVETLLVRKTQVVNRYVPELTVEFVLPRQLISIPVDQYRYTSGKLRRRLGIDYPIVVRSLERMRDHQLRHSWQGKWSWLTGNSGSGDTTWVRVPGECDDEWLYAVLCERSNVCLALAFPPREDAEAADELEIGFQAGIPIALWSRRETDPDRFVADLGGFLSSDLMSLPQQIRELRLKAVQAGSPQHPGNHLTLLFEDADRLPEPYLRLQPPN
ncbi:hypothetical protein ABGB12_21875 [Actinocorallia sp. B10E7]|uniref:VMAP-C domain-containing protein n=1 Tax=Actinocorallia sp. B10E7 TaxID=3153558 RepID=UPI00325EAD6F